MYTSDDIKSITLSLTDKFNEPIAKAFMCTNCKEIPLDAVHCKNKFCAKIYCQECVKTTCPKCSEKNSISELSGNLKEILQLIKFKCPFSDNGCAVSVGHKKFLDHVTDNCKFKKRPREDSFDDDIKPGKKIRYHINPYDWETRKDSQISVLDFNKLDNEELKIILEYRNLPTQGTKKDLIYKIHCYFNETTSYFTDEKIRKMLLNRTIENLSKSDLFYLLIARGLKTSGNKQDNIDNLKEYIINQA
jgi:hypothetical protein